MQPAQMYDSAATMFSPDGRIYQVEYAREAVKRGTTAVGAIFEKGAVLLVDKRISSKLIEPATVEKIFKVDHHMGVASSGLVGDARMLIARARGVAANNRVTYNENIETGVLVKDLSDIMQSYTQNGGVRPFGAAFIMAGIDPDNSIRLFETDPSGAIVQYKATAIGAGRAAAMEWLEENFESVADENAAVQIGLKALYASHDGPANPIVDGRPTLDIAIVTIDGGFRQMTPEDVIAAIETYRSA